MRLSNGEASAGVGGGICQLANLLHWMFLHSPLTVVERSEHSFDPFPDNGRVLPWGVGCSIVYNYVDLVVRNDTDPTFQIRAWRRRAVPARASCAPTATSRTPTRSTARDEQFLRAGGRVFRRNEIWRTRGRPPHRRRRRRGAGQAATAPCSTTSRTASRSSTSDDASRRRGVGLLVFDVVDALFGVGGVVVVDGDGAVEPFEGFGGAAGGVEGVGVGVAEADDPVGVGLVA